jgi:2-oxoglutarate dehydrogenase complex dehydrogenase (E1) component-like enzyme
MGHVRTISSFKGFKQSQILNKPMGALDNFANGTSAVYVDQMYEDWLQDPNSVNTSWQAYFNNIEDGAETPYEAPPSLGQNTSGNVNIEAIIAAL